jgi:hypothetical protein
VANLRIGLRTVTAASRPGWLSALELANELRVQVSYGINTRSLERQDKLLSLPNIVERAGPGATKRTLALAAQALISDAVSTFDHDAPTKAKAFRLLLVLDAEARRATNVDMRRDKVIKLLGHRVSVNTWRTEEEYELAFMQELAERLLALPPQGLGGLPPVTLPHQLTSPSEAGHIASEKLMPDTETAIKVEPGHDPRDDCDVLNVIMLCKFEAGRIPAYYTTMRVIQARTDGVELWREAVIYSAGNDYIHLEPLDDTCTVVRKLSGHFRGHTYYDLRLPRPLTKGELHTLYVRRTVLNQQIEPLPHYVYMVHRPRPRATVRVEFAPDWLPREVQRIVTPTTRLNDPVVNAQVMPLHTDSSVETLFTDLTEGVSYGFRWVW